jgi:predicted RNase H-like HicB family nuclease
MVEEVVKSYRVAYERDESGRWVASVRGVRGCHTQGRTVDEARRRIREALELFVDNARRASIVDDVKLPSAATRAIRAYASLFKKADDEDRRAARATRRAVRVLRTGRLKMSARDAARLLDFRFLGIGTWVAGWCLANRELATRAGLSDFEGRAPQHRDAGPKRRAATLEAGQR